MFEHLTDEVAEIKLYRSENKWKPNVSSVLSSFEQMWFPLLNEKLFQSTLNARAKFLLFNSAEIAINQLSQLNPKKVLISGDAVEPADFRLKKFKPIENQINLVFLKGASTSAVFNGLDRLISSVLRYKGKQQVCLYILGNNLTHEASLIPANCASVILKGALYGEELDAFMDQMHMGVSTLGLFRKGLHATTTIKTREYFARGLPFIYAYTDSDLERIPETKAYALQFPNDESLIPVEPIVDFAIQQSKNSNHSGEMRALAEKHLSYKVKMERVVQFFQQ